MMKMKVLSLTLAIASVAGFSGSVSAWTPNDVPDLQINMSGATAMDNSITSLFSSLCDAGTLDSYFNAGANPGNAHRAFFCTLSPAKVPLLSGPRRVLFVKRSAGGSAQGVNPIIDQRRLEALNIFNNNCTLSPTPSDPRRWLCRTSQAGDLERRYSDIGISDVEPIMFRGINTPAGFGEVTQIGASDLDVASVAALLFGVPVTNRLYNALQVVQRGEGELPNTCNVGDYTEACMPSLTKQQVATMISGGIRRWSDLRVGEPAVALTSYPGVTAPASNIFRYCRRVFGSGTGAQQYAKFLNTPCAEGVGSPLNNSNPATGPILTVNSGSGDMDLCLDNANTANQWAIGQQSMERNADNRWGYRFIKIDGVAPTLRNAFYGKYMDWVEMTYQWLKPGTNKLPVCQGAHLDTCGPRPPEGDVKVILDQMRDDASEPVAVGTILNVASTYSFGKSGYMAPARPFATASGFTGVLDENAPIMPYSHDLGAGVNTCATPVIPTAVVNKPLVAGN